jgi:hypothetical protein
LACLISSGILQITRTSRGINPGTTKFPGLFPVAETAQVKKTNEDAAKKPTEQENSSGDETKEEEDFFEGFEGMDKAYDGPLPWLENSSFQESVKKYQTPVLMAAYRASLPDPIMAEGYNIGLAAQQLAGTVVQTEEVFSQNHTLGPYIESKGYKAGPTYSGNQLITTVGGGVCKIASMLYNVVTFCDLKVISRSPHSMTVPYVPPGQDATVYYGCRDFSFFNDSGRPILIWAQKEGDTLYMAFYGQKRAPAVVWHHKIISHNKMWTERRYNSSLPPGQENIVNPGQNGLAVKSWVTIIGAGGEITEKSKGISYYKPSPRVIEYGPPSAHEDDG